jgi:hypothetical protein
MWSPVAKKKKEKKKAKRSTLPSTLALVWSIHYILCSFQPPPDFFLFLHLKSVPKGQQFVTASEVTAKLFKELAEVSEDGFEKPSKSITHIEESISLPKGTALKEMLCK